MKNLLKVAIASLLFCVASMGGTTQAFAQANRVTGTVVDEQGSPVIGAIVLVTGSTNGASTDMDGSFVLNNVPGNASISVSCIGFKNQTIAVANQSKIEIVLVEDVSFLDEVVVVGYGVQKKSDVTGSISSIKGESLANRSVESLQSVLQGKAAGVMIFSSSAAPNSSPSVRIRGLSSNSSGSCDPLYVVDGLKVSNIAYLDPSMVESMEILKDGASAAIYGAEAGNGVVLITTKNGAKSKGRIFYDFNYGINTLARSADLMNAEQYVAYQTAAGNAVLMSKWEGDIDHNWMETLYPGGSIQRHTVGFEKGGDAGTFYSALSYVDNDGMYYGNKDWMKRLTFQVNATYNIKPWLEFSTNNSIEHKTWSNADGVGNIYLYDPLTPATYDKNNLPDYMKSLIIAQGDYMFMKDENGDYVAVPQYASDTTNPLTQYFCGDQTRKNINVRGITAINFKPFKGFVFTSRLGYRLGASDETNYKVPTYYSVTPRTKQEYSSRNSINTYYEWENFANYANTFGKHNVNAMVGMSYRDSWNSYTSGSTDTFKDEADNFRYLSYSSADAMDSVGGEPGQSRSISYFGRVGYNYDNRYNIQATFRADAYDSSKLSKEARWGYFPSISAGWTISNENFMQNVKHIVSALKLRVSYGVNGNINVLGGYPYVSSLSSGDLYPIGGVLVPGIRPSSRLANPSLRWEESNQFDLGIDARLLANRLSFTVDYFNKNTSGQLVTMTAPLSSGSDNVIRNVGMVNNHGFEFELGWKDALGGFEYGVDANIATLSNKVVSLGGNPRIEGSNGFVYFDENQPVWSYYGYKYIGFDDNGVAQYEDLDNNGNINDKDKQFLGTAIPKASFGLTLFAAWKNFDLTIFGNGTTGGLLSLSTRNRPFANRPAEFWTNSFDVKGKDAYYPHPDVNGDPRMYNSSMQLTNGAYFKIKQVQLGYNVPSNIARLAAISALRVYVSLENYFCFTKYQGLDPESLSASGSMGIDLGDYPNPKTLNVGLKISF